MKNHINFCAVLLFLALIANVAYADSFALGAPSSLISQCSCSRGSTAFTVYNTNAAQETVTYVVDGVSNGIVTQTPVTSNYNVYLSGNAAQWSTATPGRFSLKSGQAQNVEITWNIPCQVKGTQNLHVRVQTDSGVAQEFDLAQEIAQCSNLKLIPVANSFEGCPCKTAVFEYIVENTGDFTEQYDVGADTFAAYATVSESTLTLEPGQSRPVVLYVTPSCDINGNYKGTFSVIARSSQSLAETPYYVGIAPCYQYKAFLGMITSTNVSIFRPMNESYRVCQGASAKIPIMLTNVAEIPNTYQLRLDGPTWAGMSLGEISLAQNQSRVLNIVLGAENKQGNYLLTINVLTLVGKLSSQIPVPLTIENCNEPMLNVKRLNVNYSEQNNQIQITNTGTREAVYLLNIFGANWAGVSPVTLKVAAGASGTFNVHTFPTADAKPGAYGTTLVAKTQQFEYDLPLTISLGAVKPAVLTGLLSFFSLYKFYLLGGLILLVLILALIAATIMKKPGEKRIVEPAAKKEVKKEEKPIVKKEIKEKPIAKARREEKRAQKHWLITLLFIIFVVAALAGMGYFGYQWYKQKAPKEAVVTPYPGGSMFNISAGNVTTNVTVSKASWFSKLAVRDMLSKAKQVLIRAKQAFCIYYLYLVAGLAVLVALVILLKIFKTAARRKRVFRRFIIWLIVLIVIAAVILGYFYCIKPRLHKAPQVVEKPKYQQDAILKVLEQGKYGYDSEGNIVDMQTGKVVSSDVFLMLLQENKQNILENSNLTEAQLNQTISVLKMMVYGVPEVKPTPNCSINMQKNTPLTINLSHSFYDPDQEILVYRATVPQHIMVKVQGEMAQLVPDFDFTGVDEVEFIAHDKNGATATSGSIAICVEAKPSVSTVTRYYQRIKEYVIVYKTYILAGVIILVVLLFVLRYRKPIAEPTGETPPRPRR